MRRGPSNRPSRRPDQGLGMFEGNPAVPQDLGAATRRGLFTGTLAGDPGLRVARSAASRESAVYSGTGAGPQQFVKQEGGTNSKSVLSTRLPVNARRTMGSFRGTPDMATGRGE